MLVYPQLASGALSQFPVKRQRHVRTLTNLAADGSTIKLADPHAAYIEWSLPYTGLTDTEMASLQSFFAAAEGSLNAFTFLDPTDNLLAFSGNLNNAVYVKGPLLTVNGGPDWWRLSNTSGGPQDITQSIVAPLGYLYCFSAYVQAAQPATVTMLIGSQRAARAVGTDVTRIVFAASSDPTFGLEIPAGATVDVYGLQAEAQGAPSTYKSSTTGGVYENARLRDDTLTITTTDLNQHSCTVNVFYANHL
jgi:hypothetical protein